MVGRYLPDCIHISSRESKGPRRHLRGIQAAEVVSNSNNLGKVLPGAKYEYELKLHATNALEMILAYEKVFEEFVGTRRIAN